MEPQPILPPRRYQAFPHIGWSRFMKIAIVDSRIPKDAECGLSRHADKIMKLPPFKCLQKPVSAHPDMLMFPTEDSIITDKRYAEENAGLFRELSELSGRRIVLCNKGLFNSYPDDVKFNCFTAGGRIFGLVASLSEKILEWAEKNHVSVKNVKQGYAKCSACVVSGNAVITEDTSIERAMVENGIDVLRVTSGQVALEGYDCGFVGGACGSDSENVYFCGDISRHPDFEKIEKFCHDRGKNCVSLGNGRLYDIGTIFFLE